MANFCSQIRLDIKMISKESVYINAGVGPYAIKLHRDLYA